MLGDNVGYRKMSYNIHTKHVKAEIDECSSRVHINVMHPVIHECGWNIVLHNKGVYADYAGESPVDDDCSVIISETDSGVSWLWDAYNRDPETFIMTCYDDVIERIYW